MNFRASEKWRLKKRHMTPLNAGSLLDQRRPQRLKKHFCKNRGAVTFAAPVVESSFTLTKFMSDGISMHMLVSDLRSAVARHKSFPCPRNHRISIFESYRNSVLEDSELEIQEWAERT